MKRSPLFTIFLAGVFVAGEAASGPAGPTMLHPGLAVTTVVKKLSLPTNIAFVGPGDMLVLEKNSGRVVRVTDGFVRGTALDLSVNNASERGLLGIAIHPDFPTSPWVYLFWSCRTIGAPADPFYPSSTQCSGVPAQGADTDDVLEVPLLANRVDRFAWNGTTLSFDRNLITLRAFQNDAAPVPPDQGDEAQPARANHDAGVIAFGPEKALYVLFGDVGRRGQLQNLPSGPTQTGLGPTVPDDQFGGPEPDNAHFSGVILRLSDDGTTPTDNPFFAAGAAIGGEVGENVARIFAYGIRNSFGMAFDPVAGHLWFQENGEDAFDEINRAEAGMNSGWIQFMGPMDRIAEYRQIETTSLHHDAFPNLQQFRWGPERIAMTPQEALSRLFVLPGSEYDDPEFSWKHVLAPAAIGFTSGSALGTFKGHLFVGFSVPEPLGGPLFAFGLTPDRRHLAFDDPRLEDRVADNIDFHDMTESESLLVGQDFGVVTDIETGPNGNLYVVSLSHGAIYEISKATQAPTTEAVRPQPLRPLPSSAPAAGDDAGLVAETVPQGRGAVFRYSLGEASHVRLHVFDVLGHRVATVRDGVAGAGAQTERWSTLNLGASLKPGIYFARIETKGLTSGTQATRAAKLVVLE